MAKRFICCWMLFVFMGLSQMSCLEEPPMLNKQDRKIIDSVYNVKRKILLKELDSICEHDFDRRVQAVVDSIMMKRLEEIERLKGRGGDG